MNRRHFLQGLAGLGAMTAFPASIQRALAIDAYNQTGTIQDVKHVVMLMLENRSFDSYYGTRKGYRGFGDRFTIPLPGGRSVWQQLNAKGREILPYELDSAKGNAQRLKSTPHTWVDSHQAWDGGRMDSWPKIKKDHSMSYFPTQELNFQHALAEAFTVCDNNHCAMHTGTHSNRLFYYTGCNGPKAAGVAMLNNELGEMGPSSVGLTWTTVAEQLEQAGVTWRVYQNMPDNFGCNQFISFRQFRAANEKAPPERRVSSDANAVCPAYDPAIDDQDNPLFKGVANTLPNQGLFDTLKQDVLDNKLPEVCWIVPTAQYSEHPSPSSPVQGGWYVQELLDALTENPEVWSKTALIITYDENDGYFDHLAPPTAPYKDKDGVIHGKSTIDDAEMAFEYCDYPKPEGTTRQPDFDGQPFGPGMRVPMYIISPWSRGGWVNSQTFDHTSVIQFLEKRFNIQNTNISTFRRTVCGDLTSAFDFKNPNDLSLPVLNGRKTQAEVDDIALAQGKLDVIPVPAEQKSPEQETGIRPSRALPYILHTSAVSHTGDGNLSLKFANAGQQGAIFHVYDKLHLENYPKRYVVEPDKQLDDTWRMDNRSYDLWVLSHNGFHRHFKGNADELLTAKIQPEIQVCYDNENGDVYVKLHNTGTQPCTLSIRDKAYFQQEAKTVTVQPNAEVELSWKLKDSGYWYDFEVSCQEAAEFYRRFAGRVETGQDSVSDPSFGYKL
ncbi:phosphocholine-specific phospholipase C [Acinetobacter sp. WZC-1]|uniref:phosphocholine-specific phospholipase C n=1 Tax=Acinetobacter sp. WZC-1 TaxID=3459034 RepID=UPI00403D5E3E